MVNIDNWWHHTPFYVMENVTGYRRDDFSSECGYQEFVDACDEWWDNLNKETKEQIYNDYN
jgi:hypothetical protein